jgi:hypothetical protein
MRSTRHSGDGAVTGASSAGIDERARCGHDVSNSASCDHFRRCCVLELRVHADEPGAHDLVRVNLSKQLNNLERVPVDGC